MYISVHDLENLIWAASQSHVMCQPLTHNAKKIDMLVTINAHDIFCVKV